jgi:hypothetical protein
MTGDGALKENWSVEPGGSKEGPSGISPGGRRESLLLVGAGHSGDDGKEPGSGGGGDGRMRGAGGGWIEEQGGGVAGRPSKVRRQQN